MVDPINIPDNTFPNDGNEELNDSPVDPTPDALTDDTIKNKAENEKERGFKGGLQDNSDNEPSHPQQK